MTIAYDSGVNFFDNAEAYASGKAEIVMGKILKRRGWGRDTFLVSSKVFWGGDLPNQEGLSRKHVIEACHAALRRLRVDYLDLYFCHRPDPNTPIEETVRAMSDLVAQGKVLYWGTSEWSAQEITEAHRIARELRLVPPTMEQPQYNMFHRDRVEKEFAPLYKRFGLGLTIWSPLASGLLTGKYNDGDPGGTRISLKDYAWLREQFETDRSAEAPVESEKTGEGRGGSRHDAAAARARLVFEESARQHSDYRRIQAGAGDREHESGPARRQTRRRGDEENRSHLAVGGSRTPSRNVYSTRLRRDFLSTRNPFDCAQGTLHPARNASTSSGKSSL